MKFHPFLPERSLALIYEYMTKAYRGMGDESMALLMNDRSAFYTSEDRKKGLLAHAG
jgi:hypothetical protein